MWCIVYFYFILNVYLNVRKTVYYLWYQSDTLWRMKHFSIYFWKICASLHRSISISIYPLWGTSFITRIRLISINILWYYNKMHILRTTKVSLAFMSHLLFIEYFFKTSYVCKWHSYWVKGFRFHIESLPKWESNPRLRTYRVHALTTELSDPMMSRA